MSLDAQRTDVLPYEQVAALHPDLIVVTYLATERADDDRLPAVTSGAVAVLDDGDVAGLDAPTPLSVPYALDLVRPALEAAAT